MSVSRTVGLHPDVEGMTKGSIRAAWPVAADVITATSKTVNWLLGRAIPLVIDGGHMWGGGPSGPVSKTLHYRYEVDDAHPMVGRTFVISSERTAGVTIDGETYQVGNSLPTVIHTAVRNDDGNAEVAYSPTFSWFAEQTDWVQLHQLNVYHCPMAQLTADVGVDPIKARSQVFDGHDARQSIAGLARAVDDLRSTYFRRGTVFNWAHGGDGFTTVLHFVYQLLFQNYPINPAIQNRLMYNGETTRDVKVNVYAKVSSGATGTILMTMTNGATCTFTVTSTSATWHTTQTLTVEVDDPTRWETDGGIRGGTRDELKVEVKVASGGQTLYLLGISMWDSGGG